MSALSCGLPLSGPAHRAPPGCVRNTLTVAGRELRDAVRSRWFVLYTVSFAGLGLGVSFVSSASGGASGLSSFARTSAGLINLVLLVIPLMALTAGAGAVASERERGMLAYLLAQPVSRLEVLLGKFAGLAAALLACLCLGLGACAAILAWNGQGATAGGLLWLVGLSFGLALSMLSVGLLVSVIARKTAVAVGASIFIWLVLAFVTDLGLMAGTLAMRLHIQELFALSLVNPLQVFKMWSLHASDGSLDVLGPAGLYATEEFGSSLHAIFCASLLAWALIPLGAASVIFARRSPL